MKLRAVTRLRRLKERLLKARLMKDARGAAAVEFALVAMPFLFMLFFIFELSLVLLLSSTLENATADAARTIRTGALQTGGGATAISFRNSICANLGWLASSCPTQLYVDVRTLTQFQNPSVPDPMSSGVFNPTILSFNPGVQGSIVLVRAFYRWPLIAPLLTGALSRGNDGTALVTSTTVFRNEPY